jgi:transcription elongation factor Elf1
MSNRLLDRTINCPYCGESMSIVIDVSAGGQNYIEDCQICCQPMQISFEVDEEQLMDLKVDSGA